MGKPARKSSVIATLIILLFHSPMLRAQEGVVVRANSRIEGTWPGGKGRWVMATDWDPIVQDFVTLAADSVNAEGRFTLHLWVDEGNFVRLSIGEIPAAYVAPASQLKLTVLEAAENRQPAFVFEDGPAAENRFEQAFQSFLNRNARLRTFNAAAISRLSAAQLRDSLLGISNRFADTARAYFLAFDVRDPKFRKLREAVLRYTIANDFLTAAFVLRRGPLGLGFHDVPTWHTVDTLLAPLLPGLKVDDDKLLPHYMYCLFLRRYYDVKAAFSAFRTQLPDGRPAPPEPLHVWVVLKREPLPPTLKAFLLAAEVQRKLRSYATLAEAQALIDTFGVYLPAAPQIAVLQNRHDMLKSHLATPPNGQGRPPSQLQQQNRNGLAPED